MKDIIKTICTTRINPDDETSPLKYGKLSKLSLYETQNIDDEDIKLIVENLTQLTHLNLGDIFNPNLSNIKTLLATERVDPAYPYTALPNLVHLKIGGGSAIIIPEDLIDFSQSQLFDQLEDLSLCLAKIGNGPRWQATDDHPPPAIQALFTTRLGTNLKFLDLYGVAPKDLWESKLRQYCPSLDNCSLHYR